jgi:Plavaka transposase
VTLVTIIITSDKTQLSTFNGDKQAWPVYLTIGNIKKGTHQKPSTHATILLGYIPVSKLECFSEERHSVEGYQIFHDCMKIMLEPLVKAGTDGVNISCMDSFLCTTLPILSAYITDYPEQCLVACCQENACPTCLVKPKERGQPIHSVLRDPEMMICILAQQSQGLAPSEFKDHNMRPINPFWKDLLHCDIFSCLTPDMLHQLHKGMFKDHVSK